MSIIIKEDKNEIRRYLLGQLEEADQERLELRLLTDPSFSEEFDTVVDEIADQYAGDELEGKEREGVEQHFLQSTERQQKVLFARELIQRAASERGARRVADPKPRFWESVSAFWGRQSLSPRTAMVMATLVIAVGLAFLVGTVFFPPSGTDVFLALNINTSDRASGSEIPPVKLGPGTRRLRISLKLPAQTPPAQTYRVELLDDQERSRDLPIEEAAQSVIVTIPANEIARGSYIIRLYTVNADGTEQRIRGNYVFNVL